MPQEVDDSNYEGMIGRLVKGSLEEKSQCLRKLLFLYENARSRIYLYERRITESLQLSLLIEEKDISLNALTLLEKIIANTSCESQILATIKKRLLSKIVLNLGSGQIAVRKVSHKCVLEFVKKFRDFEAVTAVYLRTALQQNQNMHLKVKAINSFHSLLMGEHKFFAHDQPASRTLLEELIFSAHQTTFQQIRRAALLCFLFLLKVKGVDVSLLHKPQIMQLRQQSDQLASLLDFLFKTEPEEPQSNAPSPKFLSIQESQQLRAEPSRSQPFRAQPSRGQPSRGELSRGEPSRGQPSRGEPTRGEPLRDGNESFNEVTYAEEFLKRLELNSQWQFHEIEQFAPFLEKCLVDESIKLFSLSKKIVEVIFNEGKTKEYYVVLVPCIVNGIGNRRFIVRKNIEKLVRQYIRNHTEVWVQGFVDRFALIKNAKVKEMLLELLMHAYRTSPEFYFPAQRTFAVFDAQINDSASTLKRKVVDCVLLILERQDEKAREALLQGFSAQPYSKILRKMGRTASGSYSQDEQLTIETPVKRKNRLVTAAPEKTEEHSPNISEDRKVRNSHIQINFRLKKRSKDEKNSLQKLPQLKQKFAKMERQSEKSIGYLQKEQLRPLQCPKTEFEKALVAVKESNWLVQFEAIGKIRSVIEHHKELLSDEALAQIVTELLQCLTTLRSNIAKLSLICLCELMRKVHRRLHPFTESIVLATMRKSITTSEFLQEEIKKCIVATTEELCVGRLLSALNSMRESKSAEIKLTLLLYLETLIKKHYRKEFEWIWAILVEFHEEPQSTVRNECKRLVRVILELHRDWKDAVITLRKPLLDRIQKILKNIKQLWIEVENQEFQKALLSKNMTSKYFANAYLRFEEMDRAFTAKKNWKDRIRLLNEMFQPAFDHPAEFEANAHARKYVLLACDHIDEKNPGLLLNGLQTLQRAVDVFPALAEECLSSILEKCVAILETRRSELVALGHKLLQKLYGRYNLNKVLKEYLKICNAGRARPQLLSQLTALLRDGLTQVHASSQNMLAKSLIRLCAQKQNDNRLKELFNVCQKKFGSEFSSRVMGNEKALQVLI